MRRERGTGLLWENRFSCAYLLIVLIKENSSVDDLLKSGILWAHSVIILNRDPSTDLNYMAEEHMADSKQLIATETICR